MHRSPDHASNVHAVPVAARPGLGAASRTVLAAAAAALLTVLALIVAPSASAHDSLIGSTPDNGATVTGALDSVELSFSGELKPIGSEVSLKDADGAQHDAEASVSRNVLTVDFGQSLPAGSYTLTWRVVSSDGHPIEGTTANQQALAFTVDGGAAASSGPAPAASTAASPSSTTGQTQPTMTGSAAASQQDDGASGLPTAVIWIIIAVAVVAAAAIVFAKARRQGGPGQ
ncbi:copper resistance protein CopC [Arthrobacter sp. JSM 101049]|uniref:copper resistance CopC family protein n=1 Tax=Arthrobacter sp. JSM 101049 TaxID=929097 RepID=UPI0035697C4D